MEIRADFVEMAVRFGGALLDGVIAKDTLHLRPETVRPGAAERIRRGIRRIEAYLKRLILLMALRMEHALAPDTERPRYLRPRANAPKTLGLPVFSPIFDHNQTLGFSWTWHTVKPWHLRGAPVPAFDLLARLEVLRDILENPTGRAKRLAWHLARRRHGWLQAPARHITLPGSLGTEIAAIYDAMAAIVRRASLMRPAPRGPAPRPPPRIRVL